MTNKTKITEQLCGVLDYFVVSNNLIFRVKDEKQVDVEIELRDDEVSIKYGSVWSILCSYEQIEISAYTDTIYIKFSDVSLCVRFFND